MNNYLISKWKDENNEILINMKLNNFKFEINSLKNDKKKFF